MGGNRYNREYKTNKELTKLKSVFDKQQNKLKSLFDDKILKNEYNWWNDIIRHMDNNSVVRFKTLIKNIYCNGCNKLIDLENVFIQKHNNIGKFCISCIDSKIWKTKEYRGEENLRNIGRKISISVSKFHKSKKGIKISKSTGKKNSKTLKKWFQTKEGKEQIERSRIHNSKIMKEKILNGEFTPCRTNSFTHWDAKIIIGNEIKKFRSSWEACFWLSNDYLEYENLRIPYENINEYKIYIADFYDKDKNIIYEIKPKSFYIEQAEKISKIIDYCIENKILFIWINEDNIMSYIDESKFSGENIIQLNKMKDGICQKKKIP